MTINLTNTNERLSQKPFCPDLVAKDKDDQIVLLVEVKVQDRGGFGKKKLFKAMTAFSSPIPWGMLVLASSQKIQIFKKEVHRKPELIQELKTAEILSYYEPEFTSKPISHTYLTSLIGAWLRDLAYHWSSEFPPASQEMEKIGLLTQLSEGTTEEF